MSKRNGPDRTADLGIAAPGSRSINVSTRPPPVPQDAQGPPTMNRTPMPEGLLPDLAFGLSRVLGGTEYVVVVALQLLGLKRRTSEIDLLVPSGRAYRVVERFATIDNDHFGTYKSMGRTTVWYRGPNGHRYRVTTWESSPNMRQPYPTSGASFILINSVRLLKPALQLNEKCGSWAEHTARGDQVRRRRDGGDIIFLLGYMNNKKLRTTNQEVNHATLEFFGKFFAFGRGSEQRFRALGLKTRETDTTAPTTAARG